MAQLWARQAGTMDLQLDQGCWEGEWPATEGGGALERNPERLKIKMPLAQEGQVRRGQPNIHGIKKNNEPPLVTIFYQPIALCLVSSLQGLQKSL